MEAQVRVVVKRTMGDSHLLTEPADVVVAK
jgi:hypothetical protein